uniref:Uncharacterized protein n=1 Tax=Trichobilharzia regenti TaxID=157069 RepID=A0AA85JXD5_TRIRE|nr:unnamed protein product [Trichobilharzia regenti]
MPRRRKYTSGNELIPTKYGMQSTSTKLILYNWMHPTKNRLKDPEMTANELPKSKLPCRKPLTKNHSTKVVRDPKHFHGEVNEHQPGRQCGNKPNIRAYNPTLSNKNCSVKHGRHSGCFDTVTDISKVGKCPKVTNNMKKSCFYERYNSHRQECQLKRLKNIWKQQFDVYILPVLKKDQNKSAKTKLEFVDQQMNEFDHDKEVCVDNTSYNFNTPLKYSPSSRCEQRDDLLKNAKDKYSHSVSEESFGSTIYFYCSTCSYIVGYRDREQLKQLNLEYESASSAYYLSCGDDDIGVEFDNQEDDFFNIDYLNPAYEWVKSNRPCSAPPKIHC